MIPTNLLFLYLFLPVSVLVYHFSRQMRRKNLVLIGISLLLYTFEQPAYIAVMVALSYVNYRMAFRIDPEEPKTLWIPVIINIVILAGFKYLSTVLGLFDVNTGDFRILPLGMSVFTFSAVSYMVDVYIGTEEPEEDFGNLLLYFLMFPKLIQGPIVRFSHIRSQLSYRRSSPRSFFEGFQRFLFGLAKKVLLADACGRLLIGLEIAGADETLVGVWFAAVLFLFRVYYDFSGCCDMAIGLGRMFGFRFSENFNRPYLALSISDFCARWNMTLGGFFRDYVYEPLGGAAFGKARQAINTLICCVLMGFWYGNGLNYPIFALYLAVVLVIELYLEDSMRFWPDWICRCWTLWLLAFGFILFSHENLGDLKDALYAILGYGGFALPGTGSVLFKSIPLLLVCGLGCTNYPVYVKRIFAGICGMDPRSARNDYVTVLRIVHLVVSAVVVLLLLWLCTVAITAQVPLIPVYSQF